MRMLKRMTEKKSLRSSSFQPLVTMCQCKGFAVEVKLASQVLKIEITADHVANKYPPIKF